MTISNDKRRLEAIAMRGRILAYILEPENAAGVNGPAMAANFGISEQVVASHCNYLDNEKLIQRFIYPRAKIHTPNLWLSPAADLSLIVLPLKAPPTKRVYVPQVPGEHKEQRDDYRRVKWGDAVQLGIVRDPTDILAIWTARVAS